MTILENPIESENFFFKGRGAQINPFNPYHSTNYTREHYEGLDETWPLEAETQFFTEQAKKIVNLIDTPDAPMPASVNPYQGCEHGCIYCYARNTHNYWGFSAGADFESRIIIKHNAPQLLEKTFMDKKWVVTPIMFSGNTDCYQPIERKMQLTRKMLEICSKFGHPAGIITKNSLILRDIDILGEMATKDLIQVYISITTLDESLRKVMEPRTSSAQSRMRILKTLSDKGIPVSVMIGPVIPGLNDHEIPDILETAARNGARDGSFNMVRLNGSVAEIFADWIQKTYPDKAERVLNNIRAVHQGNLNDSRWKTRMRGDGKLAESIHQLFRLSRDKYFPNRKPFVHNTSHFQRPGQLSLF